MWARNSNRTFSIVDGDMFVDKDHWSKVLETIQFKKVLHCKEEGMTGLDT